ncbi:Flp pilus assembly complex ATPase component TadA [bacterium]|nr:Flp pilus assembly complex ATPase component TadA [bacterium]
MPKLRLGEMMVEDGLVSRDQLRRLLAEQRRSGGLLGTLAVNQGLLSQNQLKRLLAEQAGVKPVPDDFRFSPEQARLLPIHLAKKYGIVPLKQDKGRLAIATAEPQNLPVLDELAFASGLEVVPFFMLEMELADALDEVYAGAEPLRDNGLAGERTSDPLFPERPSPPQSRSRTTRAVRQPGDNSAESSDFGNFLSEQRTGQPQGGQPEEYPQRGYQPSSNFASQLITKASEDGIEFIHLQLSDERLSIRMRRSGVLEPIEQQPGGSGRALFNQLKVLAGLSSAERATPQYGHFQLDSAGSPISVSANFSPTLAGERAVLRLESGHTVIPGFEELSVPEKLVEKLIEAVGGRHGLILLTGPPFSKKKNLAYALLARTEQRGRALLSVEEHSAFRLDGMDTIRPLPDEGFSYQQAVAASLAQDPDILFIDEVPSAEVVNAAVAAAYSRSVVILRMPSAGILAGVLALRDMCKEPFLLSTSLALVTGQRELRRLCPHCRRPYKATNAVLESLRLSSTRTFTLYEATGCERCSQLGTEGTVLIYEQLIPNAKIRQLLATELSIEEFGRAARRTGLRSAREVALDLALKGEVSVAEVLRLT